MTSKQWTQFETWCASVPDFYSLKETMYGTWQDLLCLKKQGDFVRTSDLNAAEMAYHALEYATAVWTPYPGLYVSDWLYTEWDQANKRTTANKAIQLVWHALDDE